MSLKLEYDVCFKLNIGSQSKIDISSRKETTHD